ncbi:hypothetical protein [Leptospira weilii]|nr:hypothetical protein [Leptospira weilii]
MNIVGSENVSQFGLFLSGTTEQFKNNSQLMKRALGKFLRKTNDIE